MYEGFCEKGRDYASAFEEVSAPLLRDFSHHVLKCAQCKKALDSGIASFDFQEVVSRLAGEMPPPLAGVGERFAVPIRVRAAIAGFDVWRRFLYPPPVTLFFDEEKLKLGRWTIRYAGLVCSVYYFSEWTEFEIKFPQPLIDEMAKLDILYTELQIPEAGGEPTRVKKPLDHIHIEISKGYGEKLKELIAAGGGTVNVAGRLETIDHIIARFEELGCPQPLLVQMRKWLDGEKAKI